MALNLVSVKFDVQLDIFLNIASKSFKIALWLVYICNELGNENTSGGTNFLTPISYFFNHAQNEVRVSVGELTRFVNMTDWMNEETETSVITARG